MLPRRMLENVNVHITQLRSDFRITSKLTHSPRSLAHVSRRMSVRPECVGETWQHACAS